MNTYLCLVCEKGWTPLTLTPVYSIYKSDRTHLCAEVVLKTISISILITLSVSNLWEINGCER